MAARPRIRASRLARMPGIRAIASALAAVCAVAGLAACGSDDEGTIPQENGQLMLAQLEDVEQAVDAQDCDTARSAAVGFTDQVDALPSEVDSEVRDALVEAGNQLVALTQDPEQCTPVDTGASDDATQTEQPETEIPEEQEVPEEDTTDEETPPPDEGGDGNSGNGNQGSGGNGGQSDGFEGGGDSSGGGIGSEG